MVRSLTVLLIVDFRCGEDLINEYTPFVNKTPSANWWGFPNCLGCVHVSRSSTRINTFVDGNVSTVCWRFASKADSTECYLVKVALFCFDEYSGNLERML